MTGALLPHNVWVLVCDGRKSLLLQNEGDHFYPNLVTRKAVEHSDQPAHDLGTDKPGRTFSGKSGRRSAIEPVDMQLVAEKQFIKSVARDVSRKVEAHEIAKFVLVAPPSMLAVLRKELSGQARAAVVAEIDKDLVRLPLYEIEQHLLKLTRKSSYAGEHKS